MRLGVTLAVAALAGTAQANEFTFVDAGISVRTMTFSPVTGIEVDIGRTTFGGSFAAELASGTVFGTLGSVEHDEAGIAVRLSTYALGYEHALNSWQFGFEATAGVLDDPFFGSFTDESKTLFISYGDGPVRGGASIADIEGFDDTVWGAFGTWDPMPGMRVGLGYLDFTEFEEWSLFADYKSDDGFLTFDRIWDDEFSATILDAGVKVSGPFYLIAGYSASDTPFSQNETHYVGAALSQDDQTFLHMAVGKEDFFGFSADTIEFGLTQRIGTRKAGYQSLGLTLDRLVTHAFY